MVELSHLARGLEVFGPSGLVLSTEQRAALQTSLILLKASENFQSVVFWGKIVANRRDYFIAQAYLDKDPTKKKSFYRLCWICFNIIILVFCFIFLLVFFEIKKLFQTQNNFLIFFQFGLFGVGTAAAVAPCDSQICFENQ
jgi:hypothetical protein